MPRTLLCTMRRGERAHGEGPRGTKHKQGKQPEKGARGGTRAKEENAAHHVVYHARHASDLSRRVVGEACRQVRGEQAHQALVCPDHVKQEASNGVTGCVRGQVSVVHHAQRAEEHGEWG